MLIEADEIPLETFKEHFKQYMSYLGTPRASAGIVKISYQFLSDGQGRNLGEAVGFFRHAELPKAPPRFRVIPGFRR
ncbi:MAG TPA: hypothetical protein VGY31_16095 [Terriglobia bacterium]|nr:hypothetical protein [Terriglobia bacterium]